MRTRSVVAVLTGIFILAASGFAVAEQMQFRGRLFTGNALAPSSTVKITYEGLSKPEDLAAIFAALNTSGPDAMLQQMLKTKVGNIQFIGGTGLQISLNMAFEKKTEKGLQLFLVAESQKADPNSSRRMLGSEYVLVLQMDLDEKFNGEGKIMEEAIIRFSATGEFSLESYRSTPKMIVNIRKQ